MKVMSVAKTEPVDSEVGKHKNAVMISVQVLEQ